jgi:uncharacterized Zn-binding protein involved in type VI secretion
MAQSKYLEDTFLNIARGLVLNASSEHKFGAVPSMSQSTTGTVWDKNDTIYPWSAWDTAGVLVAAQANASDNGKTVTVLGLDANYNQTSESFTLSSSGTTTGSVVFKRAYRAFMIDGSNVANVSFSRGGTEVLRITAVKGQTLMAIYTVPAGYTAYLMKGVMSVQAGADATGDMFVRYGGQSVFRIGHSFECSGNGGEYMYEFTVPIKLPEKSDIDVRTSVRTNNARVTSAFDLILIESE